MSARIVDAAAGTEVTVRGTIAPGSEQVTSPGGVECVYWAVPGGSRGGQRFWLTDDSGRALVDPMEASVAARAELRERVVRLADAELGEVESRLRELKSERKSVAGPRASDISRELKRLRKLATLLCAIRARARGNVHIGGTLGGQDRYISERSPQFSGSGSEVLRISTEVPELVLREGDEIEVTGLVSIEPIPPELFAGGYRDLPTCAHLRAPAGGALVIRGVGDAAPRPVALIEAPEERPRSRLAYILAAAAAIYGLIELLGAWIG